MSDGGASVVAAMLVVQVLGWLPPCQRRGRRTSIGIDPYRDGRPCHTVDEMTTATATDDGGSATWLTTGEAARRLRVTVRQLYGLIDDGRLPAYRMGRVIRLRPTDVARIEEQRDPPWSLGH